MEKLLAFKTIAESGSFRRAAEVIGIAQPALTRSIRVLEEAVGKSLFKRSVRGVELTREGRLLFEYAVTALKNAEDIHAQMHADDGEIAGVLTIGTFASLSMYLWPQILSRLNQSLPRLQIRLKTREADHIENLSRGLLDLVVDAEPRPRGNMVSTQLYSDKFNFYVSTKAKAPDDAFIFVPTSYDENDKSISDFLRDADLPGASPYEIDSFETAKALTIEGVGIGIMPVRVAEEAVESKRLRRHPVKPFPPGGFGRHKICATIREEDRNDRRIRAVIKEMKTLLA